jgi:predicted lipoprotein with Yx(FWY)xxD motif
MLGAWRLANGPTERRARVTINPAGVQPIVVEEIMRRVQLLLAGLLATGAAAGATAAAQAHSATAHAAKTAKVQLRHTSKGKILVNASGFTLYRFTKDPRNKDTCISSPGEGYGSESCTEVWPPLTTTGKPIAGAGVKSSLLGTIKLPGGRKQVTYAGHPLYLYKPASGPGETGYIGAKSFGGTWEGVSVTGGLVK